MLLSGLHQELLSLGALEMGIQVSVQSRTWPGINKPGGAGRVTKVHSSGTAYDVKYVLGGHDRRVPRKYVRELQAFRSNAVSLSLFLVFSLFVGVFVGLPPAPAFALGFAGADALAFFAWALRLSLSCNFCATSLGSIPCCISHFCAMALSGF